MYVYVLHVLFLFWRFPLIWLCTSCPHFSPCLTLSDLSYPPCCRTLSTSAPFLSFMHAQFLKPAAVLDCNHCLSLFGLMFARRLIRFLQSTLHKTFLCLHQVVYQLVVKRHILQKTQRQSFFTFKGHMTHTQNPVTSHSTLCADSGGDWNIF